MAGGGGNVAAGGHGGGGKLVLSCLLLGRGCSQMLRGRGGREGVKGGGRKRFLMASEVVAEGKGADSGHRFFLSVFALSTKQKGCDSPSVSFILAHLKKKKEKKNFLRSGPQMQLRVFVAAKLSRSFVESQRLFRPPSRRPSIN